MNITTNSPSPADLPETKTGFSWIAWIFGGFYYIGYGNIKKGVGLLIITTLIPFSSFLINIYPGFKARDELPIGQKKFQWKPTLVAFAITAVISSGYINILETIFGSVPECNSDEAQTTITEIIESNFGLELYGLKDFKQSSFDEEREVRKCRARIVTNAGEENIKYKITWINMDKDSYFIELY
jgi:hypothetical protein